MMLRGIVACDMRGGIGFKGSIPWNVPADKLFFESKHFIKQ